MKHSNHWLQTAIQRAILLAVASSILPAQSPVTLTGTNFVAVQLGQPLYCAAKWTAPNVQVYCYTSSPNHTWDLLIFNSVFPVTANITLPYVANCLTSGASCAPNQITWLFHTDSSGAVNWEVAWNGTGDQKGTFQ